MTDAPLQAPERSWRKTVAVYFTPVMLSMLILGFASGLPLYMVFQKLSFWLRDSGIDRTTIGFFYWVTMAYTLKVLWAPVIDRVKIPILHRFLGPRRSWIVTAICGTVIALALISQTSPTGAINTTNASGEAQVEISVEEYDLLVAIRNAALTPADMADDDAVERAEAARQLSDAPGQIVIDRNGNPRVQLSPDDYKGLIDLVETTEDYQSLSDVRPASALLLVIIAAVLLAYSSATLDTAIDAWRIESAPNDMQANMAAAYSLGYRIAYMTSGLGLAISEWANWSWSFLAMAAAMAITAALVFFMKEPPQGVKKQALQGALPEKMVRAVIEPFRQFIGRMGWWLIPVLLFVTLYRISDFTMGVMAAPLYSDLDFARDAVGAIQGGPGLAATIFGLFLGGVAAMRFGLMRALVVGLIITLITNGAYAWLAATAEPDDLWRLTIAIVGDNVAGGFVTTCFIAYLSSLVDPENAATQYALLSSFYAILPKFMAGFSGVLADSVEWVWFFILTAAWTIPAGFLLALILIAGPPASKGLYKFAERRTTDGAA